jgi:hypothetical protein
MQDVKPLDTWNSDGVPISVSQTMGSGLRSGDRRGTNAGINRGANCTRRRCVNVACALGVGMVRVTAVHS